MRVLVTGGSGTFGTAFLERVLKDGAERAVALSRHEVEMAALQARLGHHVGFRRYLGDVRDADRLEMAFQGCETVVHAAALKRIEQCELDPIEAVETNVNGSKNVINAALRAGVSRCILLSTDKAVNPVNLYGATKLTAERLFVAANNIAGGRCKFCVARYGNIWGSRGSVVHQWRAALASGLPVKLTDGEATRYFMRPVEAVDLVLGLITNGSPGEIRIPELRAYRLGDLVLAASVPFKRIERTGLPPHEKMHETLDGWTDSSEAERMTVDDLIRELDALP